MDIYVVVNQGFTNRLSGHPGQPEEGAGQPDLMVWLPNGQLKLPAALSKNVLIYLQTSNLCFRAVHFKSCS